MLCLSSSNRMKIPKCLTVIYSVALTVLLGSFSRAQWAPESYVCLHNHSFCLSFPSLSFFYLYFIYYSLDPKAVKYSSSNYDYMPEKPLASSIWPASNCPHCLNLQLAIDVVWESLDDTSLWAHHRYSKCDGDLWAVSTSWKGCFCKSNPLQEQR